jgi:hypothetical protein
LPVLLLLCAGITCSGPAELPSPTLRVDLRAKLPRKVLRRLMAVDTSYECSRKLTLRSGGASQRFIVTSRVFDFKEGQRYLTAVQVEPDGPTEGGSSPEASAAVGEPVIEEGQGMTVPVNLTWSARAGCSKVTAGEQVKLASNDPACKPPSSKVKIFEDSAPAPAPATNKEPTKDE